MESMNHTELLAAFADGKRLFGQSPTNRYFPQFEFEVILVREDRVVVRSAWGGTVHIPPNAEGIKYFAWDRDVPAPGLSGKIWLESPPSEPWDTITKQARQNMKHYLGPPPGIEKPQQLPPPQPKPIPNVIAAVTHLTSPTLLECRVLTGNWIMAIVKRLFGWDFVDVECSIQNFGFRNGYVTFELHTEHGDDLFIRLRPEAARTLAENINEGEAKQ